MMEKMLNKYPSVTLVDLTKYIPVDGIVEGKVIFADEGHLNIYGSRKLAELFIKDGKILISKDDIKE